MKLMMWCWPVIRCSLPWSRLIQRLAPAARAVALFRPLFSGAGLSQVGGLDRRDGHTIHAARSGLPAAWKRATVCGDSPAETLAFACVPSFKSSGHSAGAKG